MRHATARLLPDLDPGVLEVGPPVLGVVVLVRIEVPIGRLRYQAPSFLLRAVSARQWVRVDDLAAVNPQDALALGARVGRQADGDRIAEGGADHRVSDAGVAARGVEDRLARREGAGTKSLERHPQRGAVLHRSAGVEVLCLDMDLDAVRHTVTCASDTR